MSQPPSISILIRTYNSEHTLEEVVNRMPLRLNDELIIVDSGSTDATLEIARRYHARIIETDPPFNYSRALNEGFRLATNPWVLVISSHCIPLLDGLLERMREVASTADPMLAVAYGIICLYKPTHISSKIELGGIDEWNAGRFQNGGNTLALYRRSLCEQQSFDEDLATAEDLAWFLWAIGAGYRAAIVRDALGFYRNQGSLRHMFRKGWFENRVAYSLLAGRLAPPSIYRKIHSLFINLGHLGKILLKRQIPFRTFMRQVAHTWGSFLSFVISPPKSSVADRRH